MFLTGLAIFLAMLFVFVKLPRRTLLRLLRYDLAIDIVVTLLVLAIHFGTFSGVMAATVAGLMTSLATTGAKRLFGFIQGDVYRPGLINLKV
jgi:nucleoside permease NupC